ncbi:MAG: polysaccharide deacetylase family protein [Candidatus Acidiferrales bacterium]
MRARDEHRALVLIYHAIGDGPWAIQNHCFEQQIGLLHGAAGILPLCDLIARSAPIGVALALTFDDGYACLRDNALPVLANFGLTAAVCLNIGEMGDRERRRSREECGYYPGEQFLTWRDVEDLVTAGWRIGSHGVGHVDLTVASAETRRNELSISKRTIEERTGAVCDVFAYTWGRNNGRLRDAVRCAGYRYALAGDHSAVNHRCDRFAIPRMNVAKEYTLDDLTAIIRGDWDYLGWVARTRAALS